MVSSAQGSNSVIHTLMSKILINAILLLYRLEMFIQIILMSDSREQSKGAMELLPKDHLS